MILFLSCFLISDAVSRLISGKVSVSFLCATRTQATRIQPKLDPHAECRFESVFGATIAEHDAQRDLEASRES